jgi:hypothetical protein
MKLGRNIGVKVNCLFCGKEFETPQCRIHYGFGKFCCIGCSNRWHSQQSGGRHDVGIENATKYYDKRGKRWSVHWLDEDGTQHSNTWSRWEWERKNGPIPKGYVVCYKDEDKENTTLENLELRLRSEETAKLGRSQMGRKMSPEACKKMSDAKKTAYLDDRYWNISAAWAVSCLLYYTKLCVINKGEI